MNKVNTDDVGLRDILHVEIGIGVACDLLIRLHNTLDLKNKVTLESKKFKLHISVTNQWIFTIFLAFVQKKFVNVHYFFD